MDVSLALLAAALLGPPSVQLITDPTIGSGWMVVLYIALALLHLPMFGRRQYPRLAYASSCLGMLLLTIAPYVGSTSGESIPAPLVPSALLFFVLLYTVAEQLSARWALACLVVALLGGALVLTRIYTGEPWWSQVTGLSTVSSWLVLTALIVAGSVGAYGLGRLRRTRRAYLAELQERARRTEIDRMADAAAAAAAERRRIAREMHDVVSHSLAVMISQAEGGKMLAAAAPNPQATSTFATIATTGRAAMADMRAMLGVLREDELSLHDSRSPQPSLGDLPRLLDQVRSTGCRVTFLQSGMPRDVSASVGLVGYRLVQEALTNVMKHAGDAPSADVALDWRGHQLAIQVVNEGGDIEPARGGAGLPGMRERVEAVGGSITIGRVRHPPAGADPEAGRWQVSAVLPLSVTEESL
ncbi:MAG: histidine kinase [Propionibacteriaceae bacterium]